VAELQRHLGARGIAEPDAQSAIDELCAQGYLDDARYVQRFVEDRRTLDGWGAERIERALRTVGVDDELIAAGLGDRGPGEELDAAVEVLRRRLRRPPEDERGRQRALALLVRRGYELEVSYDAVRRWAAGDRS
jgi:regulatory protein